MNKINENVADFIRNSANLINSLGDKNKSIDAYNNFFNLAKQNLTNDEMGILVDAFIKANVIYLKENNSIFNNLEIYFYLGYRVFPIGDLVTLKDCLMKYYVDVKVDYNNSKIRIVFLNEKNENVWQNCEQQSWFKQYSDITLKKVENGNFNDLVHFIYYHTVEKIEYKDENFMRFAWTEIYRKKDKPIENIIVSEMLGCYLNNRVYLCRELIEKTAKELQEKYLNAIYDNGYVYNELNQKMFNLLYKKVFTHEFGHLVFNWVYSQNREIQEKQANYFSSYINDGEIDGLISDFTKTQNEEYHNPYLKGDKRADNLYLSKL